MKMIKREWVGKWIEPEQEAAYREPDLTFEEMVAAEQDACSSESHLKCAQHLRRVVDLENEEGELPVLVTAYASAHGVYELYINGKHADNRLLAPETTNYNKLLWYQTYSLTDLVADSSCAYIDVLLGDGWWIGRLGMAGSSCNYGEKLGFLMDLELTYPDGSVKVIGSDEQFISCESFIRHSDLYIGEMQDTTLTDADMFFPGLPSIEEGEEPVWMPCHCTDSSTQLLAAQPIPGIQVVKEIPLVSYVENAKGELVADFGQVLAGAVRIQVDAPCGSVITLDHGEVLDKEGNYYSNIKGLFKDQRDRFVCRGGVQEFSPHFTYHGFRYVRISGIPKEQILSLTALVYATPFEQIGTFETDNELLNQLQHAIENSTISNMISVPTDCPQREKLGWTGDINIFTKTGAFLYDIRRFLEAWLLQVRLDQAEDGEIPVVVPNHPCQERMQRGMSGGTNSSAAWSDCCIFMPLHLYQIYGDISVLEDNYDSMEKWLSYVEGQTHGYLWNGRFHFGDWLIPSLREEPDGIMKGVRATSDIVGSCYYSLAVEAMIEICRILGKEERKEYFEGLLNKIQKAIVNAYVYPDGRVGVHATDTSNQEDLQLQGLYVVMLRTGAVTDPSVKAQMLSRLVELIKESDYTLDCGFSSIAFLLDVLYENGYPNIAYKLLFSTKAPSWLYMVKNGATTIWENWRAILEDGTVTDSSYNHYAYGCVGEFMYRHIGGIEELEPGYTKVRIAPDFHCGIRKSTCTRKLPGALEKLSDAMGNDRIISCSWEILTDDDTAQGPSHGTIRVELPEGVTGVLVLPGEERHIRAGVVEEHFVIA